MGMKSKSTKIDLKSIREVNIKNIKWYTWVLMFIFIYSQYIYIYDKEELYLYSTKLTI